MRVIAGIWRGRKLAAPSGEQTRPMLDRAKVVLFDRLGSRLAEPGHLPPIAVLDLYAGAGTLGLECLSRGARYVCFVERAAEACRALRANIDDLDAGDQCTLLRADAIAVEPPPPPDGSYELIFVDPPFRLTENVKPADPLVRRLDGLAILPTVSADALLVLRQSLRAAPLPPLQSWTVHGTWSVGHMKITLMGRATPA